MCTTPATLMVKLWIPLLFVFVLPMTALAEKDDGPGFNFSYLLARAKKIAAEPYVPPAKVPDLLMEIDYDAWRDIRFRTDKSLWRGEELPFELQFFHPGLYFDRTITFNVITDGKPKVLRGTRDMFDYGKNPFAAKMPKEVGFAGFRIHSPFKKSEYFDEFLVFLGASYLRGVGRDHHYGLSARGLAVDTSASSAEEFPWFREFWIVKPKPGDKHIQLYALLDSPRMSGAYSYRVTPGAETVIDVKSAVILRKPVEKLGIAPLTSMYFFGENSSPEGWDDYRPEVHDSDGLQVHFSSGEWLWRPLQNWKTLQLNSFHAPNIRGFGLLQRDRDFEHYQDLEARYENRPSVWIEPQNNWGPGQLELVQLPTEDEIHDNIVAAWLPENPPVGKPLRFDYRMRWMDGGNVTPAAGHTVASRIGTTVLTPTSKTFVIDFDGEKLRKLAPDTPMEARVEVASGATLTDQRVYYNPIAKNWRLAFHIELDKPKPGTKSIIEIRAFLLQKGETMSETWSYAYKP